MVGARKTRSMLRQLKSRSSLPASAQGDAG
jgi:hypothetical protein